MVKFALIRLGVHILTLYSEEVCQGRDGGYSIPTSRERFGG
jgi:hypothetical protein